MPDKVPAAAISSLPNWTGQSLETHPPSGARRAGRGRPDHVHEHVPGSSGPRRSRWRLGSPGMRTPAGFAVRALLSRRRGANPQSLTTREWNRHRRLWLAEIRRRRQCRHLDGQRCHAICAQAWNPFPGRMSSWCPIRWSSRDWKDIFAGFGAPWIGICWRSGKIGRPSRRAICAAGSMGRIPARSAGHTCLLPV